MVWLFRYSSSLEASLCYCFFFFFFHDSEALSRAHRSKYNILLSNLLIKYIFVYSHEHLSGRHFKWYSLVTFIITLRVNHCNSVWIRLSFFVLFMTQYFYRTVVFLWILIGEILKKKFEILKKICYMCSNTFILIRYFNP